jgi:hypothetical protein
MVGIGISLKHFHSHSCHFERSEKAYQPAYPLCIVRYTWRKSFLTSFEMT